MNCNLSIYIVNFNTTLLTNIAIASILQHSKLQNFKLFVFDNSTKEKFKLIDSLLKIDNIELIDNTEGKYIDFNEVANKYFKLKSPNNYASAKHAFTIQWMLDNCTTDDMLIFDSDIICKSAIDIVDSNFITAAHHIEYVKYGKKCARFEPFVQYFNVKQIKFHNLRYFDPNRMHGCINKENDCYDTGASFYEDCIKMQLNYHDIEWNKYIIHMEGGSWMQMFGNNIYLNKIKKFLNNIAK